MGSQGDFVSRTLLVHCIKWDACFLELRMSQSCMLWATGLTSVGAKCSGWGRITKQAVGIPSRAIGAALDKPSTVGTRLHPVPSRIVYDYSKAHVLWSLSWDGRLTQQVLILPTHESTFKTAYGKDYKPTFETFQDKSILRVQEPHY